VGAAPAPQAPQGPQEVSFVAPGFHVAAIEVVEATELEILAAIVVLKARAQHFGPPKEVSALPFNPREGWRQAALAFIRSNQQERAKGNGTFI
jgi:hypothetical protein